MNIGDPKEGSEFGLQRIDLTDYGFIRRCVTKCNQPVIRISVEKEAQLD
jgi:hypothetical protein